MPCRSDHMEPNAREQATKKAADLIVYVYSQLKRKAPDWAIAASLDCYGRTKEKHPDIIGFLCDHLREMSDEQREEIIYGNPKNKTSRRLADWWEAHLEDDKERVRLEKANEKREIVRKRALSKLSEVEKRALGY